MSDHGDYPTARFAIRLLIEELQEAYSILEDYHDKCSEELEKTIDFDASETEHCSSFLETYGKDYDRLTCHEHDMLRHWSQLLAEWTQDLATCPECMGQNLTEYQMRCRDCDPEPDPEEGS